VGESVRLRRELRGLGLPIDVVVVGRDEAERRSRVVGTVFERARSEGKSLPDADVREEALGLLARAQSDLRAVRRLADDADQDDDVVGFHAQQATEKALKASLIRSGASPRPSRYGLAYGVLNRRLAVDTAIVAVAWAESTLTR
jgi:hypothetical protein